MKKKMNFKIKYKGLSEKIINPKCEEKVYEINYASSNCKHLSIKVLKEI